MTRLTYWVLGICALIVGLHIWGTIDPAHENWGMHFFSFYDSIIGVIALGVIVLISIPKIQRIVTDRLDKLIRAIAKLPLPVAFIGVLGVLYLFIYLYPAKLHLLGDGAVLLRSVPLGITGDQITTSFKNQPLMFWIYRMFMNLHPFETAPNAYTVYYSIDIIAAIGFIALLFWSMRSLSVSLFEKVMLGCFLLFGAGMQFFFGYIENYVLQYVATTAYVITGWFSLERRIPVVVPILFFVLMVMLHLGSMVFLPSIALLFILKWKKKKIQAVMFLAAAGVVGIGILYAVGFSIIDMTRHLRSGSVDFLKPFSGGYGNFPYPMFSFIHLLDLLNAHVLLAPFGLLLTIIFIPALPVERRWKNPILMFLLVTAGCGLFFTFVINSALGLARDWDLFASFFVPLLVLPVYFLSQPISLQPRRYVLFILVLILLVRTASFIGINSSEEKHLTRMRTLNSEKLLSKAANMAYDEGLANFFFDSQRYADARIYYEHFLTIDSTNPRIIGNISDVYRRLGDKDKYFRFLQRAVAVNSPDPGVYSNIGVEYANRGDTNSAIMYNERAIQINPGMQKAHANLGILYSSRGDFATADRHFTTAINLGMREPILFRYAGDIATFIGDYRRALNYYDTYLANNPKDERVRSVREKVYEVLTKPKK